MDILKSIAHLTDLKLLREIEKKARDRHHEISKRKWTQKCEEVWQRLSKLPSGTILFCCQSGVALGETIQRGDKVEIFSIQPRKRVIWLKILTGDVAGHIIGNYPKGLAMHNWQLEPPENPIAAGEKKLAGIIGGLLTEGKEG